MHCIARAKNVTQVIEESELGGALHAKIARAAELLDIPSEHAHALLAHVKW